jgi:hypothetical protein
MANSTVKYNYEYFKKRLDDSKKRIDELEKQEKCLYNSIKQKQPELNCDKKKRKYSEAMGYENDYECVQEPSNNYSNIYTNKDEKLNKIIYWKDAYTEKLFDLKTTSST